MTWLVLRDGAPEQPSYDDLLAGRTQPGPHAFLRWLYGELAEVGLDATELVRETSSFDEVVRGYCGSRAVGYAWRSERIIDDSAIPISETYVTYGLPGATLTWSVSLHKRGQLGHATWSNNSLAAQLDDPARTVLERLWAEVFGRPPVFVPAWQWCEDLVGDTMAQLRADLRR